ncbi:MAG: AAA family ATPase, partial [Microbacterium sp.]
LFTLANQRLALLGDSEQDAAPITVTSAAIDEARAELEELANGVGEAAQAAAAATREVVRARAELDALDADIAAQSALVSEHDLRLAALRAAADAARSTLAAVRGGVLRQQNALDAAIARRAEAEAVLAGIGPDFESDATGAEHAAAYERAQRDANEAETAVNGLRERLHAAERELDALTAQSSALARALDLRGAASDLVARGGDGIRGLVGDTVQVEPGFEAAIAAVLGPLAEGVLVDTLDDARAVALAARDAELGVVDIVVAGTDARHPVLPEVAGVVSAREIVSAPAGVLGVLASVVVADDLEAAFTARSALSAVGSGIPITIVTRSGEVVTEHTVRAGAGEGRSRLELSAERDAATERLAEIRVVADTLREALGDASASLEAARRRTKTALETLRAHDAALAAHTEQVNRATVRHEGAAAECERLANALAQAQTTVADAEAAAREAEGALQSALEAPRPILDASARDGVLATLEDAREAEMRARLDVETLRERVRAQESQVAAMERRREAERTAAAEAARRAVIRRGQRDTAREVIAQLPAVLESVDRSVAQARLALATAEQERAAQNAELGELRQQEAGVRARLSTVTEGVHTLELQIHEKRLHVQSLRERALSELGLEEDILVSEYGPDQDIPIDERGSVPFDRAQQRRRLQDAERKLGQLGRVNPLALEEFAALEQRHVFLTEQLNDLMQTRKDLLTIIAELDERMQSIFRAAFDDTRSAFHEVFPILFPGGTGDIALTNPDDILTTGIEVTVRPVGKKIERLSLLSGGERSLAAVALLTAIFKARPSPFYILDEVEAALDDANLGRLLGVFEQLRASSQLIVITHQKRTMEIADALYGVSMRQDGVSAVVGQRVAERVAS